MILASQIEPLIIKDPMYAFLLFGHLVSKVIDNSFFISYLCWYGSFGIDATYAKHTLIAAIIASIVLVPIFGNLSDRIGFEYQLVFVYGMRLVSVVSFFFLRRPDDWIAILTVAILVVSSYAE